MSREQRGPNEKLGTVLALAGISNATSPGGSTTSERSAG